MSCPFAGLVATLTVNRPVSSRCFFKIGVVPFQLWLFCPSTISALYCGAFCGASHQATAVERTQTPQADRNMAHGFDMARCPFKLLWRDACMEHAIVYDARVMNQTTLATRFILSAPPSICATCRA